MPKYYPIFLDVRRRRCVVIGGNETAEEKTTRLLEHDADVMVISPELTQGLHTLAINDVISWTRRSYNPGDLEDAFIAIVADTIDTSTNRQVHNEAKAKNVPLNVVDIPSLCTWIAPAIAYRGDVTLAASTGGASPALARRIREELDGTSKTLSSNSILGLADLSPLLADARKQFSERSIRLKPDHWQACLTNELVELVQAGHKGQAMQLLMSNLIIGVDCDCIDEKCRMFEDLGKRQSGT